MATHASHCPSDHIPYATCHMSLRAGAAHPRPDAAPSVGTSFGVGIAHTRGYLFQFEVSSNRKEGTTRGRGSVMLKEFKEFAMRGNVIDMAVGIIIGAAFGKIVSSLVTDI